MLGAGGGRGGKFYAAAILLKSVIKDRAYLPIDERVDNVAMSMPVGFALRSRSLLVPLLSCYYWGFTWLLFL